jgi:hypothetical protein
VGAISSNKFDKEKCFKQVRLFGKKENLGHSICGLCVKICRGKKQVNNGYQVGTPTSIIKS